MLLKEMKTRGEPDRNLACGDSNGSNRFEIDRVGVLPGPFHGNEGREVV